MQNFLRLGYMLRVLLAVSASFPDNPLIYFLSKYDTNILCSGKTVKMQNQYHTPSRLEWLNITKRLNLFDLTFMNKLYLFLLQYFFPNVHSLWTLYILYLQMQLYSLNCKREATWTFEKYKPETCFVLKYTNRTGKPDPVFFLFCHLIIN